MHVQWFQSRWHRPQNAFYMGIHIKHLFGFVPSTLKPLHVITNRWSPLPSDSATQCVVSLFSKCPVKSCRLFLDEGVGDFNGAGRLLTLVAQIWKARPFSSTFYLSVVFRVSSMFICRDPSPFATLRLRRRTLPRLPPAAGSCREEELRDLRPGSRSETRVPLARTRKRARKGREAGSERG